jgi:hypothetical protein
MSVNPTAMIHPAVIHRGPVPAHRAVAYNGVPIDSKEIAAAPAVEKKTARAKEPKEGFSFWDFVDIINPLQHIPVVNTIYRSLTGDEIGGVARVAGGALFGGPIGAAFGAVNAVVASGDGEDLGDRIMAKMGFGGNAAKEEPIAIAATESKPTLVEVRPTQKDVAQSLADIEPGAPAAEVVKKASFDPMFDAVSDVKKESVAPKIVKPEEGLNAPLQAQIRRYNTYGAMPHKESVAGLPPKKDIQNLKPVEEASSTPSTEATVQQQMLNALAKYEKIQNK